MPSKAQQKLINQANREVDNQQMLGSLRMSEDELQGMIDQLMRNLGTTQRQSINRAEEVNAMNDVPLATEMARERGINYQTAMAGQEGSATIEKFGKEMDRDAALAMINYNLQQQQMEMQEEQSYWNSFMQMLGAGAQGAGYYFGASV